MFAGMKAISESVKELQGNEDWYETDRESVQEDSKD
jgi:hypothetical protein